MSLILKDIVKAFKDDVVLDGVSLSVDRGETLVLFGPSGAGKTVLLRLIAGVIEPDAGTIILQDRDMNGVEPEDRGIGMAFQNFALFPHMEAKDNIAAPLTARKMSKTAIAETVGKIARMLKIDHVLGHKPKELSNGQKQARHWAVPWPASQIFYFLMIHCATWTQNCALKCVLNYHVCSRIRWRR